MTTTFAPSPHAVTVEIAAGRDFLTGHVARPETATGVVLFADASRNSRLTRNNQFFADELNRAGFATVLGDLLTFREGIIDEMTSGYRFDITLLSRRVIAMIEWAVRYPPFENLPLGLFGADTGAAAALDAAAGRPGTIRAVVSRSGRVDLAREIAVVDAATMFIAGTEDTAGVAANRETLARLTCEKKLTLVPGASHGFQEDGALEKVAWLANDWFVQHLR